MYLFGILDELFFLLKKIKNNFLGFVLIRPICILLAEPDVTLKATKKNSKLMAMEMIVVYKNIFTYHVNSVQHNTIVGNHR